MAGDDRYVNAVRGTALEQPECVDYRHPEYDCGWYPIVSRVCKDALIVDALCDPCRLESWPRFCFRVSIIRHRYSFALDDRHGRQRNYSRRRLRSGGRTPGYFPICCSRGYRRETWIHQSY